MPRCLMAKKWKAYPWPDRQDDDDDPMTITSTVQQDIEPDEPTIGEQLTDTVQEQMRIRRLVNETEDEEIDVVGDSATTTTSATSGIVIGNGVGNTSSGSIETGGGNRASQETCWGPHSPTAGATAPSPPPLNASGALYYHGYTHEAWLNHEEPPKYATLRSAAELARPRSESPPPMPQPPPPPPPHPSNFRLDETIEHPDHRANSLVSERCASDRALLDSSSSIRSSSSTTTARMSLTVSATTSSNVLHAPRKSLSMCYTSTGTALSLPPKKKDIYRPYSLQSCSDSIIRSPAEEDLSAAQAILDLSASPAAPTHSVFIHTLSAGQTSVSPVPSVETSATLGMLVQPVPIPVSVLVPVPAASNSPQPLNPDSPANGQPVASGPRHNSTESAGSEPQSPATAESFCSGTGSNAAPVSPGNNSPSNKTVAYTYEAFFVSDGRSKRRSSNAAVPEKEAAVVPERPKFTCTECGKQYATSSNLSRHKQTHRSLDSQSAKKCIHCGKAYVSMPALAMHVLTHKLAHSCGVCGKMFSRPWLLQGHLRSHTGEKPYGCAHCGKAFADRSNLRAHMQTHSADKNYECSRCHKTFALKSYLNKHLESACLRDEEMPLIGRPDSPSANDQSPPHHHHHHHHHQFNRGL